MNARNFNDLSDGVLEAVGVGVTVGGKTLLRDISARFHAGQVTAILGPNGAGKSTLLSLLTGQRESAHGQVRLEGRPLASHARERLARERACVAQETQVAFDFSVQEVVELGRYPHLRHPSPQEASIVPLAMQATAVDHLAQRALNTLSGGEKARAHLARALAQVWEPVERNEVGERGGLFPPGRPKEKSAPRGGREPHAVGERGGLFPPGRPKEKSAPPGGREPHEVGERGGSTSRWLLLDEPTAALDLQHQHRMLQLVRDRAVGQGVGVVAVLHDLNLALRYSDRCVVLQAGALVASGPTAQVLTPACIEQVWGVRAYAAPARDAGAPGLQYLFEPLAG